MTYAKQHHEAYLKARKSEPSSADLEARMFEAVKRKEGYKFQNGFLPHINHLMNQVKKTEDKDVYRRMLKKSKILAQHWQSKPTHNILKRLPGGMFSSTDNVDYDDGAYLAHHADVLIWAKNNRLDKVQLALPKVLHKYHQETVDKGLVLACEHRHKSLVRFFMKRGADLHYNEGEALEMTARYGKVEQMKTFVQNGADVSIHDNKVLMAAITGAKFSSGHLKMVQYLVEEQGVDIHAQGDMALFLAVVNGEDQIAEYLIEKGADMEAAYQEMFDSHFEKYWPLCAEKYKRMLDASDISVTSTVEELRQVVDEQTGTTGFGLIAKAGRMGEALEHIRERGEKLSVKDLEVLDKTGTSGVKWMEKRGYLSNIFNAKLWSHEPHSLRKIWDKLDEETQETIDVKKLFQDAKNMNFRKFVGKNKLPRHKP